MHLLPSITFLEESSGRHLLLLMCKSRSGQITWFSLFPVLPPLRKWKVSQQRKQNRTKQPQTSLCCRLCHFSWVPLEELHMALSLLGISLSGSDIPYPYSETGVKSTLRTAVRVGIHWISRCSETKLFQNNSLLQC